MAATGVFTLQQMNYGGITSIVFRGTQQQYSDLTAWCKTAVSQHDSENQSWTDLVGTGQVKAWYWCTSSDVSVYSSTYPVQWVVGILLG